MTRQESYPDYNECYEYHGNTMIEMTRIRGGITILRDWLMFDSVEEADAYFNDRCSEREAV
ncbi:MAG: hypothetical protein JW925_05065 [Syntrophaceae bacterium]|nr:hypothetical protein [Syntrophaceae bacterium]